MCGVGVQCAGCSACVSEHPRCAVSWNRGQSGGAWPKPAILAMLAIRAIVRDVRNIGRIMRVAVEVGDVELWPRAGWRSALSSRQKYNIMFASEAPSSVFKDDLLSFSTEHSFHRRRSARGSTTTGRDVSHGLAAKTASTRFTVLRPGYGLSTLSMRTLGYICLCGGRGAAQRHMGAVRQPQAGVQAGGEAVGACCAGWPRSATVPACCTHGSLRILHFLQTR